MSASGVANFIVWLLVALLSIGVGGYAVFQTATGFAHLPLNNPVLDPWGLRTHVAASGIALLIGAFQFLPALRRGAPALHRWTGRLYVLACVVGGLAGGAIALGSTAGPVAGWGFLVLACLWVPFTLLALAAAMRRDFIAHERWMIRSFALTFAAVTLRIYLPAAVIQAHGQFPLDAYRAIAWLCWVPNLVVAELLIAAKRKPRRPRTAPSPTPA